MKAGNKKFLYGGLIILGGIVVIIWMRNYLVSKGVIEAAPTTALGNYQLKLQDWFIADLNAQPGTVAHPATLQ